MPSRYTRSFAASTSTSFGWAESCSHTADAGLIGVLFVAPLFFSGRHDLGRLVFVSLVAVTAAAWFVRQAIMGRARWHGTAAYGVLAAAIALVALQLVPLPAEWISRLAPRNADLLPLWSSGNEAGANVGAWRTLSLAPGATQIALAMLAAYVMLFVTVVQRLEKFDDVERLLRWIALAAVAAGSFALLQHFTANGLYFWFYRFPYYEAEIDVVGSFLNKNHLAHFVVLGMAPLLAMLIKHLGLQREKSERQREDSRRRAATTTIDGHVALAAAALSLGAFTVLLSLSRGGAISLAACSVVALGYYWRRKAVDARLVAVLVVPSLAVVAMLAVYGYDRVANRLDDLAGGSLDAMDTEHSRRQIWAANVAAIRDGGLFGAGAGTHAEIYPAYMDAPTAKWFTHAENGYLEIITENGAAGGLLLAIGAALVCCWCVAALRRSATTQARLLSGAVAAAITASFVHSVVDFVWYVPACMSVTVLLAACALRLAQLTRGDARPAVAWSRSSWRRLSVVTAVAGAAMVGALIGPGRAAVPWDQYQVASLAQIDAARRALRAPEQTFSDLDATNEMLLEAMTRRLEEVVRCRPNFARAHQRLSKCYMQQFELRQQQADNAMPIAQICDAAMASSFKSPAELRTWLRQAFGVQSSLLVRAYVHARKAVELAPLIPDSYLQLAKLCFLEGRQREFGIACVDQALKLGPFDGDVLYEAGVELGILGDWERANKCWRIAFRTGSIHQLRIIQSAPGRISIASFLAVLEPDWNTLRAVWAYYFSAKEPTEGLQVLAKYAEQAAINETAELKPSEQADIWLALGLMQRDLLAHETALASFQRAAVADPTHYNVRKMLGITLAQAQQWIDAEPHLRWCLSRRPDDRAVSDALAASLRGRGWASSVMPRLGAEIETATLDATTRR